MTEELFPSFHTDEHTQVHDHQDTTRVLSDVALLEGGAIYRNAQLIPTDEQLVVLATEAPRTNDDNLRDNMIETARLLRDGAKYHNGALKITGEQHEQIRDLYESERDDSVRKRMILHSELDVTSSIEIDDILRADQNKTRLHVAVMEVLEPYATIFDEHVPAASQNIRSKFKDRLKTDESLYPPVTWEITKAMDHVDLFYNFHMKYAVGEKLNTIQSVHMYVSNNRQQVGYDELKLSYTSQSITQLNVYAKSMNTMLYPHTIGEKSNLDGTLDDFVTSMGINSSITFDLSPDNPSIKITGPHEWGTTYAEYRYDATRSVFLMKNNTIQNSGLSDRLTTGQFLGLVRDVMRLIPAKGEE